MTPTRSVGALATDTDRAVRGRVDFVDVPEQLFATIDGSGAPEDAGFLEGVAVLYTLAYGVRFALRERGVDEKVAHLEALWWTPDPAEDFADALDRGGFSADERRSWSWRAMMRLPAATDDAMIHRVQDAARERRPERAAALATIRVAPWREGLCAQTLHVGPYEAELPTVALLHQAIAAAGYEPCGHHHEIYLSDPWRCAPARLRTVLRQPVIEDECR